MAKDLKTIFQILTAALDAANNQALALTEALKRSLGEELTGQAPLDADLKPEAPIEAVVLAPSPPQVEETKVVAPKASAVEAPKAEAAKVEASKAEAAPATAAPSPEPATVEAPKPAPKKAAPKESGDPATLAGIELARAQGRETIFDRANKMKPCNIGTEGICCKVCSQGPCRLPLSKAIKDGSEPDARLGLCGATPETIVTRNLTRMI